MDSLTCSAPDCDHLIHVKKWMLCRSHYNRFMSAGDLDVDTQSTPCAHCGEVISANSITGPPPRYCTVKCRRDADYARNKDRRNAEARAKSAAKRIEAVKACRQCGESFTPENHSGQKFCTRKCKQSFHRDASGRTCSEPDCSRPVRARGMCSMHWRRWARSDGNETNREWNDQRRASYHKRRALKRELPADDIRPLDVYERDEWTCGLCGKPVRRAAKYPDPLSPSLDHILPLSKGGHHVMENVQLAHLDCNVRKGNRVKADAMLA